MSFHTLWTVTGIAGVVYGLVVAFGPRKTPFARAWLLGGSAVVGILFITSIVLSVLGVRF